MPDQDPDAVVDGLTRNQAMVLRILVTSEKPLTAYNILESAAAKRAGMTAPPTIYRALERLTTLGLAHRIESLNAYHACDHIGEVHSAAFVICDNCGKAAEFKLTSCRDHLIADATRAGFQVHHAQVELHGLCERCAAASQ